MFPNSKLSINIVTNKYDSGFVSGFSYIGYNVGVGLLLVLIGCTFAMLAGAAMYLLFKVS